MFDHGDLGAGILALGQTIGLIHDIPTVKELFDKIMNDVKNTVKQLESSK